jgi:hypothetical protein
MYEFSANIEFENKIEENNKNNRLFRNFLRNALFSRIRTGNFAKSLISDFKGVIQICSCRALQDHVHYEKNGFLAKRPAAAFGLLRYDEFRNADRAIRNAGYSFPVYRGIRLVYIP